MANPYRVLGVAGEENSDEVIRQNYLALIHKFSPEHAPERFREIREAFEKIKDEKSRLEFLLFDPSHGESIDDIIAEESCQASPKRPGLTTLMHALNSNR